jgi:hypothetical protein
VSKLPEDGASDDKVQNDILLHDQTRFDSVFWSTILSMAPARSDAGLSNQLSPSLSRSMWPFCTFFLLTQNCARDSASDVTLGAVHVTANPRVFFCLDAATFLRPSNSTIGRERSLRFLLAMFQPQINDRSKCALRDSQNSPIEDTSIAQIVAVADEQLLGKLSPPTCPPHTIASDGSMLAPKRRSSRRSALSIFECQLSTALESVRRDLLHALFGVASAICASGSLLTYGWGIFSAPHSLSRSPISAKEWRSLYHTFQLEWTRTSSNSRGIEGSGVEKARTTAMFSFHEPMRIDIRDCVFGGLSTGLNYSLRHCFPV